MRFFESTLLLTLLVAFLATAIAGCPSSSNNKPGDLDVERCDGIDEDEDGTTDEGCDLDGDGFCGAVQVLTNPDGTPPASCPQGIGDCDDQDALRFPGAVESCNDVDDDCDQSTDEGCDEDGDGFCDASLTVSDPAPSVCPQGGGDCQSDDSTIHPNALEICDNVDQDCDQAIDEGCDEDGDGYCNAAMEVSDPLPYVCPNGMGDCDDTRPDAYPGALEICNDLLDDCDSQADQGCDADGDGYCTEAMDVSDPAPDTCPMGPGDCDDENPDFHPNAQELCFTDLNCDEVMLGASADQLALMRAAEPGSLGADLSFDGTQFGAVWIEQGTLSLGARFATLNTDGQIILGPLELTPDGQPALAVAVAYYETDDRFAIAYTMIDPPRNQISLFLTFVDQTGTLSTPVYIDQAMGWPKVMAAESHVGIFYAQEAAYGEEQLLALSYDPALGEVSEPISIMIEPNAQPGDFSFRFLPNMPANDGTFYAARNSDRYQLDYQFFALFGDGTLRQQASRWDLFVSDSASNASLATIGGDLYVLFISEDSSSVFHLKIAPLDENLGSIIGPPLALVTDAMPTLDYSIPSLIEEDPSSFGLLYNSTTYSIWNFIRFDSASLAPLGPAVPLELDNIYTSTSAQAPHFFDGTRHQLLNSKHQPNFFDLIRIDGAGSASTVQPVVPEPYTSLISPYPVFLEYDPAQDVFNLVQFDPDDPSKLEHAVIDGAGNLVQPPTELGPLRDSFAGIRMLPDGTWIYYNLRDEVTQLVVEVLELDSGSWTLVGTATFPIDSSEIAVPNPIGQLADGSSEWLVLQTTYNPDNSEHWRIKYQVFAPDGSLTTDLTTIEADPAVASFLGIISGGEHLAIAFGYADHENLGQLLLSMVNREAGVLTASQVPAINPVPNSAPVNFHMLERSGSFDGQQFFMPIPTVSLINGDYRDTRLLLFTPDLAQLTEVDSPDEGFPSGAHSLRPGIHSLISGTEPIYPVTIWTIDQNGNPLASRPLSLHSASSWGPDIPISMAGGLSLDGQNERYYFIAGDQRHMVLGGACTEPL